MNKQVKYSQLGVIDYQEAWDYQEKLFKDTVDLKIENRKKEELGEDQSDDDDILELKKLIKAKKLPKEVKKKVEKEISKLSKMPAFSAEASVVRNYVETVLDLPWSKKTKDILDIKKAHDNCHELFIK